MAKKLSIFVAGSVGTWTVGGGFLEGIGSGLVQGAIGGGIGGFTSGAAGAALTGAGWEQALGAGFKGAAIGAAVGGIVGAGRGFRQARIEGRDPFTGNNLPNKNINNTNFGEFPEGHINTA